MKRMIRLTFYAVWMNASHLRGLRLDSESVARIASGAPGASVLSPHLALRSPVSQRPPNRLLGVSPPGRSPATGYERFGRFALQPCAEFTTRVDGS